MKTRKVILCFGAVLVILGAFVTWQQHAESPTNDSDVNDTNNSPALASRAPLADLKVSEPTEVQQNTPVVAVEEEVVGRTTVSLLEIEKTASTKLAGTVLKDVQLTLSKKYENGTKIYKGTGLQVTVMPDKEVLYLPDEM